MIAEAKKTLHERQQEAVTYTDSPLLIVAGAGTGKTTVISQKIAYLIDSGKAQPHEIVALTFTDKAAQEMQDRVDLLVHSPYLEMHISTFHEFCQRLLERCGVEIGLPTNFKLFTETDSWLLVRDHLYDFGLDYYRPMGNPTKHVHELLNHFSRCKDQLISGEMYLKYAEDLSLSKDTIEVDEKTRVGELANAYHTYNQLLLNNNALDFGDLIFYTVKLLRERPRVANHLRKKIKYILVDEFQDVNVAQYELVKLLSQDAQLTVVGDDDQSIYAFRGASVENILRFKDDYKQAKEIVLTENYRSGQKILDTAYTLIQHNNPDRLEAKLNIDKRLHAALPIQATVEILHAETLEKEAQSVIDKIREIKKSDIEATWDDFAILVRANSHASIFMEKCEQVGLPYEFISATGLYRQPVILDALSMLKVLRNTHDSLAMYRILHFPFLSFSDTDVYTLLTHANKKSISFYEALAAPELELSEEGKKLAEKIRSCIQTAYQKIKSEKPSAILHSLLESIGYMEYLTSEVEKGNAKCVSATLHLSQFFESLEKYQSTVSDASVHHFLEYQEALLESGDEGDLYQPTDTPDSINILTIHGSKGLEFKYVFMVNMVEDRFPTRRRGDGIEIPTPLLPKHIIVGDLHYAEERRLCYVGITRAQKGLWLTSAENYGGVRSKKQSRFLVEMGLVEESKTKKTTKAITPPSSFGVKPYDKQVGVFGLPSSFSFSQLKTYETCPYKYKLAHILKLPAKGNASMSFGQSMHSTLQRFYERVRELNSVKQVSLFDLPNEETSAQISEEIKVPTLQELLDLYEKHWIPDWYANARQREDYFAKGKEILKLFYTSQEGSWTIPVALESGFKIMIGDEYIKGRIDRIDQLPDGTLEIIDYKTGKTKEKLDGEDKEQLLLYQIAASTLPSYRNIGSTGLLSFYYLSDNVKTSFTGTGEDLEKLKEKLHTAIEGIKTGDFTATPSKFVCGFCDFKGMCEYRAV